MPEQKVCHVTKGTVLIWCTWFVVTFWTNLKREGGTAPPDIDQNEKSPVAPIGASFQSGRPKSRTQIQGSTGPLPNSGSPEIADQDHVLRFGSSHTESRCAKHSPPAMSSTSGHSHRT